MYEEQPSANEKPRIAADLKLALTLAGFVVRSVRRHKLLVVVIMVLTMAGAILAWSFMPRTYVVQSRILTGSSYLLPTLTTGSSLATRGHDPTRGALEIIKSRQNLKGIIDESEMVAGWAATRHTLGKGMDWGRELLRGPMTEEGLRAALVDMLDDKLSAYISGDVLVIRVEWHTDVGAQRLAEVTQRRFLAERMASELAEVKETVNILQSNIASSAGVIEAKTREVVDIMKMKTASAGGATETRTVRVRRPTVAGEGDARELKVKQRENDRALRELQAEIESQERARDLALRQARDKLNALQQSLGPQHPDVQASIRMVRAREEDSDKMQAARAAEARLIAVSEQIKRKLADRAAGVEPLFDDIEVPVTTKDSSYDPGEDPEIEQALTSLNARLRRHEDLIARLSEAETARQVSEAAFDFRYIITVPPLKPDKASKPQPKSVFMGGIVAALFLALFGAVAADLKNRVVVEPWMVEVTTGIPVLGEFQLDASYDHDQLSGRPRPDK